MFGADLIFEVELLACELIFERLDLTKRQGVFYRDGDLVCDLAKQLDLIFGEVSLAKSYDPEGAELAAVDDERDAASRLETCFAETPAPIRLKSFIIETVEEDRLAGSVAQPDEGAIEGDRLPVFYEGLIDGEDIRV